ncbi:MAG: hypothetical protein V4787_15250 [Pseudomonadota bacterium]
MSDLRDARFRKALEHAPDADLRPGEAVRRQILARARDAVREARPAPWWRALWAPAGQRMPWNAALATIAVASLITVLWHDRQVPDARPEAAVVSGSLPAPAASSAVLSVAVPAASVPPAIVRAPASSAARARTAAPSQAQPGSQRASGAADLAAKAEGRPDAASAAGVLRDSAPTELAKVAPRRSESAAMQAPGAAAPAPRAPAARMATQFAPSPVDAATQIHVRAAGRTVDAALQKPSRLADLLQRMAREPRNADALETGVDTLIELREDGELVAMLELAGEQARWTILRAKDGASGAVRPPADVMRQLRGELERFAR